jgi:hypothetical protein
MPVEDASAEGRSIFTERVSETQESAERSGRAAGAGWSLYVFGAARTRSGGRLASRRDTDGARADP